AEFLRRELLAPLDMADSIADLPAAQRMPPGHEYYFGRVRRAPRTFDTSGLPYGYLAGSVTDLAHLAILHTDAGRYHGEQVLSEDAVAGLHRPGPPAAGGHYGPGWRIGTLGPVGARIVWHAGAITGYHTIMIAAPDAGWAVAVQQNAWSPLRDGSLNAAGFGVLTLALGGTPDPPPPASATTPLLGLGAVILILTAGLILTARRLVRRASNTHRTWPVLLGAGTAAAAGLLCATGAGLWLPHTVDLDLRHILRFLPDIGHLTITVIILGLALTATATALLVQTLLRLRSRRPAEQA
ncbi:serine hydrolase domain-containing protein, partial [Actinophytocola sp.]|uniref:serine hydrolase domain-containing protein n=1 Tax=Actinophytocola sp. TaxID=1872138 RepID=UPI002D7E9066